MTLLAVSDLHVHFVNADALGRERTARALNGISFSLDRGEILGIVGETGAGKSLTAQAVMGLLRPPARLVSGRITLDGTELTTLDEVARHALRGADMTLVVQNPKTSLDPLARIGEQIIRIQRAHKPVSRAEARERALQLLDDVGIPDPARRARSWPYQLSGGMAQRVLIALALANEPRLIIADEPTTGLDVTVQAQILDLLRTLAEKRETGLVVITHDLGVVAQYCRRVVVMFGGAIVESGLVGEVLETPAHPYTRALLAATPEKILLGARIPQAGPPPNLYDLPPGCVYADRCAFADGLCQSPPPSVPAPSGQLARCHHLDRVAHA